MEALILDGKELSKSSEESIKKRVEDLYKSDIKPTLATILVGNDPASETYVKMKRNPCARVGMESIAVELPETTTTEELLETIKSLNSNNESDAFPLVIFSRRSYIFPLSASPNILLTISEETVSLLFIIA